MIDGGLAVSVVLIVAMTWWLGRRATTPTIPRGSLADAAFGPVIVGALVARASAMALDHPAGLVALRDLLVVRSGMELWPGVGAGIVAASMRARRGRVPVLRRLADLAPFGLVAYATYEGTCLLREGCYGPPSRIGLIPDGLVTRMFPVGVLVAVGLAALAFALYRCWLLSPASTVAAALAGVAIARSVASIWLPRIGDGLTRQHLTSLVVSALAVVAAVVAAGVSAIRRRAIRRQITEALPS